MTPGAKVPLMAAIENSLFGFSLKKRTPALQRQGGRRGIGGWFSLALVIGGAVINGFAAQAADPAVPRQGSVELTVKQGHDGLTLGVSTLRWAVEHDGRYRIELETRATGPMALLTGFAEIRRTDGVWQEGQWRMQRSVRARPGRADEVMVRLDALTIETQRKGKTYRYEAPPTAQDFLSLLLTLAERCITGPAAGETWLLSIKSAKRLTYQRKANDAATGCTMQAVTEKNDWSMELVWREGPLRLVVSGEDGTFSHHRVEAAR